MKISWLRVCSLLWFLILFHGAYALGATVDHPSGVIAHCFDGDTMKLQDRRVVRLAGVDAPEVPHRDTKGQYYAREAKAFLQKLGQGNTVTLTFPGRNIKDRYGRLIAEVFLEDGSSLNELLVKNGAVFFYPHADLDPQFQEKLKQLQEEAIREKRGLWQELFNAPCATENYIGNRQSKRFFPVWCPEASLIKPRNQIHFGNLMDAFIEGYAPARICVFWPNE